MYRALLLGVGICVILGVAWSAGMAFLFMPRQAVCTYCIVPLSRQQQADSARWVTLEAAAGSAQSKGNWAKAEAAYRAQTLLLYCPFRSDCWVELGLMRDYQGKHEAAFQAYYKGFGIGSHRGPCVGCGPEIKEAAARCGLMCEDRNLHADACECYYTAQRSGRGRAILPMTLAADATSSATVRRLLTITVREAQDWNKHMREQI